MTTFADKTFWTQALRNAAHLRDELMRRGALFRQPEPQGMRRPARSLFLAELRHIPRQPARGQAISYPPALRPMPAMLLPGFGAHPRRMEALRRALAEAGHEVYDWGLGANFGPSPENFAFLIRRVASLARRHEEPIALIGWSLGGLFAREIARREPRLVAKVITLGTPFSGDPRNNNAWRAYQFVAGHAVDAPPIECDFAAKPPVPTIALWSPRDGVIHPRSACGWPGERDRAVALRCSHLSLVKDRRAILEVLRQLDVAEVAPVRTTG